MALLKRHQHGISYYGYILTVWLGVAMFVKGGEANVVKKCAFKFSNLVSIFIYYS